VLHKPSPPSIPSVFPSAQNVKGVHFSAAGLPPDHV
jgi:hypothetical protein